MLDTTCGELKEGEVTWIEALDHAYRGADGPRQSPCQHRAENVSPDHRQNPRWLRLRIQPSLDRNRILELAELNSSACDTGKSHLATALAVEAVKAGKSVAFATLADIVITTLREHLRFLARASLLVVDEIGYLQVVPGGGNLSSSW